MKKKIPRILGVALTLMLLTSLTVGLAVAPASAATGKWNAFTLPAAGGPGGFVYSADFTAAKYITKAIDGTLYCYNYDATDNQYLFKSTDDGRSWGRVGGALMKGKVLVDIATSSKDADTLYVATEDTIYVSTNAATGFSALVNNGLRTATALISSIDVGYVGDTAYVFMATVDPDVALFGGLYVLGAAYGAHWTDLEVTELNNAIATEETRIDVYDIAVMPDFETGQGLVAVVGSANAQLYSVTKYAGANWGANVTRATLTGCVTPATSAQIAFPDDFSSVTTSGLMEYFVGVDVDAGWIGDVETWQNGVAEWSTAAALSGSYGVLLSTTPTGGGAGRVFFAWNQKLSTITDMGFSYKMTEGFGGAGFDAIPYMVFELDTTGDGAGDSFVVHHMVTDVEDINVWAAWELADDATIPAGYWVTGSTTEQWHASGAKTTGSPYADWDEVVATFGTDTVLNVKVYVGKWASSILTAYHVDDVQINGEIYDLELGTKGDVFRVVQANALDRNIAGAATATNVTGLDVVGNVGAASIIAGKADALGTYVSTDHSATWTKSKKAPVGLGFAAWIVMADDFAESGKAWAATSGAGGGVYLSVDSGLEWNGVGLLSTDITGNDTSINDFAIGLGSETVFVAINTATDNDNLWRHDGTNWEQVYADQLGLDVDMVAVTDTFSADTTVFIADTDTDAVPPPDTRIARSTDGGDRWGNQLGSPTAINSWIIQGPSELLVGGTSGGAIYQTTNNGTTWNTRTASGLYGIVSFALSPEYDTDTTVVCGSDDSKVARSTDAGVKWAQIPAGAAVLAGGGQAFVAFNQLDANMVYAVLVDEVGGIFRYTFGAAAWQDINDEGNTAPGYVSGDKAVARASDEVTDGSTGIVCAPDGTLYVADPGFQEDDEGWVVRGMVRSINPTAALTPVGAAPYFEVVKTGLAADTKTASRLIYTPGSNKIWMFDNTKARKLWYYDDACTVASTGLKASVGQTGGNLGWGAIDSATQYVVWYNRADLAWSGATKTTSGTDGLNIAPGTLVSGTKYHFRVCVNTQKPALSPWSAAFEFTTKMGAAGWSPIPEDANFSPSPGATGVDPVQTLFQWNPSAGADGYEFQLSDNAAFAGADTKKVKAPTYGWPGDLEYGKTYYWRVRAYTADTFSEWATAIFTTAEEPVAPTPPVVVQPSPPPPTPTVIPQAIPDYLLITIVAIGAVLVIALIVLIVKTRRVA